MAMPPAGVSGTETLRGKYEVRGAQVFNAKERSGESTRARQESVLGDWCGGIISYSGEGGGSYVISEAPYERAVSQVHRAQSIPVRLIAFIFALEHLQHRAPPSWIRALKVRSHPPRNAMGKPPKKRTSTLAAQRK